MAKKKCNSQGEKESRQEYLELCIQERRGVAKTKEKAYSKLYLTLESKKRKRKIVLID